MKDDISKLLSLVLRHKPEELNLKMDGNGWVSISQLIEQLCNLKKITLTISDIKRIVGDNNKKRFVISDDDKYIRASQGHSIDIDLELKTKIPPRYLYHGTATKFAESIKKDGIKAMSRQYVHLSDKVETAISVGKRHGKPIILEINTEKMIEDGFVFYISENNVWLVNNVPIMYIKEKG